MSPRANRTKLHTVSHFSLEMCFLQHSPEKYRHSETKIFLATLLYPGFTRVASSPYLVLQAALLSILKP